MTTAKTSPTVPPAADLSAAVPTSSDQPDAGSVQTPSVAGGTKTFDVSALPVRPGEDPWTADELDEVSQVLADDIVRFQSQIEVSTAELVGLLRDGSEGAGRDPADVGSANFERDAEMSLANNAREMLDQSKLALRHIQLGTYGSCDNCGQPIGKYRLQAFPRATLCVTCKQREERR
ncbi:MAG TPA: TraR/DksA family transcriptional regulator [Propionibacteriaceae bacterium]